MADNHRFCCAFFGLCCLMCAAGAPGQTTANGSRVEGRTVIHQDESRTESVKDLNKRELTELTYNAAGQLSMRKVFLLNAEGQTTQGNIYDAQGNLVARCRIFFDDFGRIQEERMSNLKGGVFQRIIHPYSPDGKALNPQIIHVDAEKPAMRSEAIDFTKLAPQPDTVFEGETSVSVPTPQEFHAVTPGQGSPQAGSAAAASPQDDKPKPSFWKRLFKKKDND